MANDQIGHGGGADARVSDFEALNRLYELGNRCARAGSDLEGSLGAILDAAIFITAAEKGILQLFDPQTGALVIRAQRGFGPRLLDFFSRVHEEPVSACSAALSTATRIVVEDVTQSGLSARGASADVLLAEGVCGLQATPLVSSTGGVLGVISTHFTRRTRLTERELRHLDLLARGAADYLERRQIGQQLLEKQWQFENITAHVGTCIMQCSQDLRYLFVNRTCAEFLGRPPEQIVGHPIAEVIGEAAFYVIRSHIDRVLAGERIECETEIAFAGPGIRYVHLTYVPDLDPQGSVCGWIGTIDDITERKRLEERLRTADRHKNEFLAILAHELRNLLAPIRYALATTQKSGRTPEQQARAEAVIERQVAHMVRLLDDLLDVSRISRNRVELKKGATDLASVLGVATEAVRPMIYAKGHTISVDLPQETVRLEADSVRLAQVFSNLLINAAKYTDPGGHIELKARQEGAEVVVSVRDNGIGIPAELLPRLFTLYTQSRASADRSEDGLGIGLALVRGIVELHGGRVEAASQGPDQGSEFIVRLPLGQPDPQVPNVGTEPPRPSRAGLKVLLADDNRDAIDTCAVLLELSGHHVQTAYTGRAALELAEAFRPHAFVLDIGLPDIDGYELAERIRTAVWGQGAVLVAVTGFGQEEDRTRAFAAGFDHHLTKPITGAALEALLDSVGSALGSSTGTVAAQRR